MNVTVERPKGLPATFTRCVADVFERGVLTISGQVNDVEMDRFAAGDWVSAVVTDDDGDLVVAFVADQMEKAS